FGQANAGNAVDTISMTNSNDIKPATATLTSGGCTKFVPFFTQVDADLAIQLCWEWAGTHASGVGFGDPQYIIQIHGAEAGACRGTTCGGVGRSEEHTSELQSRENLVCRLLLEKKKMITIYKNR